MELWQVSALVGVGLFAGIIGGLLGVGGSIIMIPAMDIILIQTIPGKQHLLQAAAMIVNVFVAGPAAVKHWLAGAVLRPIIRWLVPGAVIGVLSGVALSNIAFFGGVNAHRLAKVFAAFLAYVAVYNIYRLIRGNKLAEMDEQTCLRIPPRRIFSVGVVMGLAAGLTGIGGGALAVPLQQVFLRMPLKRAIANSACTIVFSAIIGSIYKNATLYQQGIEISQSFIVAACLIPSAFVGGWFGAHLTHKLPRGPVRILFIMMLVYGSIRMWTTKSKAPETKASAKPAVTAPATVPPRSASPASQPG